MSSSEHRVQCRNEQDGREFFKLDADGSSIRITTPGALTRTRWSREQAAKLRDALGELLDQTGQRAARR